jgi:hypothetical protein
LAGNLNSGRSYLITAVTILIRNNFNVKLDNRNEIPMCQYAFYRDGGRSENLRRNVVIGGNIFPSWLRKG